LAVAEVVPTAVQTTTERAAAPAEVAQTGLARLVELQRLAKEMTVVVQVEQRAPTEDPVAVVVQARSVVRVRATSVALVARAKPFL
jgi:hypothetical protein